MSAKKMLGDLPPSSVVDGMMFWAAYCIISRPGKGDLGDALVGCQGLANLCAWSVDDVECTRRQDIADHFGQLEDRPGRWAGRLDDCTVPCCQRWSQLPRGH